MQHEVAGQHVVAKAGTGEFDLLRSRDFLLARQQGNLAHLHQIDADRIINAILGARFDLGFADVFGIFVDDLRVFGTLERVIDFDGQFRIDRQRFLTLGADERAAGAGRTTGRAMPIGRAAPGGGSLRRGRISTSNRLLGGFTQGCIPS